MELSIVLVILGLLTGGILSGQSLIRAAELRSVSTDLDKYRAAVMTFREKYIYLPGDMPNATKFWGALHATLATCKATTGTGTGTCDGTGDGAVRNESISYETFQAWRQLANAGLVEGTYTGIHGGTTPSNPTPIPGTNVPRSKIGNAGFNISWVDTVLPGSTSRFPMRAGNMINFGASSNDLGDAPAIRAEEAWNIDTKLDDGKPAYGLMRAYKYGLRPNCTTTDSEATAEYDLDNTVTAACNLVIFSGL